MPTEARCKFVQKRVRLDFKANKQLTDPDEIALHIALGHAQLDNIQLQSQHLTTLQQQGILR